MTRLRHHDWEESCRRWLASSDAASEDNDIFAWIQPGLDKAMRVTCTASCYEDNGDGFELWVPESLLFPMQEC